MASKKPKYYRCPLQARSKIIDWIFAVTHQRRYHGPYPFCFNVKVWGVDFSFDHLLEIHRKENKDPLYTHDDAWLKAAREKHEEHEDSLWEWAQEDCCADFVGRGGGAPDSDVFNHLWDGTKIDVEYSFQGRSGGWLSIDKFEGYDFTACNYEPRETLEEMDYRTLRNFYQLIVMLYHDLQDHRIRAEFEHNAAWVLFENLCEEIPRPDAIQKKLPFMAVMA